jgi:hypothetical protein
MSAFQANDESSILSARTKESILRALRKEVLFVCYDERMELFDVVDRDDIVVGTTDKKTAHSTGQLHRVGAVYVFDDTARLKSLFVKDVEEIEWVCFFNEIR